MRKLKHTQRQFSGVNRTNLFTCPPHVQHCSVLLALFDQSICPGGRRTERRGGVFYGKQPETVSLKMICPTSQFIFIAFQIIESMCA